MIWPVCIVTGVGISTASLSFVYGIDPRAPYFKNWSRTIGCRHDAKPFWSGLTCYRGEASATIVALSSNLVPHPTFAECYFVEGKLCTIH